MNNLWIFFRDSAGRWCWQYRDGMGLVALSSSESFATEEDAKLDARFHGYGLMPRPVGRIPQGENRAA